MRQKLKTLALLAIAPVLLTACSAGDLPVIGKFFQKSPEAVTLTYWGLWEKPAIMEALISKYQEQNPHVTITYDDRSVMDLTTYSERAFARAQQEGGPDIMRVHSTWMAKMQPSLSPLPQSVMSTEKFSSLFYPVVSKDAVFANEVKGVPLYYDGLVLLYNKDHFNEVGQVGAPTAWEEFRRLALELTIRSKDSRGELVRAGAAMGSADNIEHFSDILGLMWAQAGVAVPKDIDTQSAADALDFYLNFLREDKVWSTAFPNSKEAFVDEKVSMIFVPTWGVLDVLEAAPGMNIGVAPVPQALPDEPVAWSSYWLEVVPASSPNSLEAWKFLAFLVQEEQQMLLYSEASKARPFGAPYSLVSLGSELADNEYVGAAVRTAPFASSSELAGRSGNSKSVEVMKQVIGLILQGELTTDEALSRAKNTLK